MSDDAAHQDLTPFQQRLLGLLGDADPLQVLAATPDRLEALVGGQATEILRTRVHEGKWTANEILGHLVDHETVMSVRLRIGRFEDDPVMPGYDQERWVAGQRHDEREPREHLERFALLRRWNMEQWRAIEGDAWERVGRHTRRGPESLALMLKLHAGHDLAHLDQLARYVQDALERRSAGA